MPEGGPWITATRHHPASARLSSTTFAETVRGHRAVEDGVPSGLDTACRQDDARARKDTAPEDLAMI